jgi:TolB-like protein
MLQRYSKKGFVAYGCVLLLLVTDVWDLNGSIRAPTRPSQPAARLSTDHQDSFEAGVARIASRLAAELPARTIAVFEFPDLEGQVTNLGRLVSEQLTTELVQRSAGGKVVERRQVLQILTELNLLKTDLTGAEVEAVGRQLGADAIALGTISIVGDRILVNARLVGVSGGQVLAAERMSIRAPRELLALANAGRTAPTLTPKPPEKSTSSVPTSPPAQQSIQEPPQATSAPAATQTFGEVTITTPGCDRRGETVTCRLTLTNSGQEAEFTMTNSAWGPLHSRELMRDSNLYDDAGSEFTASRFKIGNKESVQGNLLRAMLVSGVPTAGSITFSGVPAGSTKASLLEIVAGVSREGEQAHWTLLRFRNLPIR